MKRIHILVYTLINCLIFSLSGCKNELDLYENYGEEEGDVKIVLLASDRQKVEVTRAVDESLLKDVQLLFFNGSGDDAILVKHSLYDSYGTTQRIRLRIGTYNVVAIANIYDNVNIKPVEPFEIGTTTLGDLKRMTISMTNPGPSRNERLVMSSDPQTINITAGDSNPAAVIPLKRLSTKVQLNIWVRNQSTVTLESWQARNVAVKSLVINPDNNLSSWSAADGMIGLNAVSVSEQFVLDPSKTSAQYPGSTYRLYKDEFYLYENLRGDVPGITDQKQRNGSLKPDNATHLSLLGFDRTSGETSKGKLLYTIHLGTNNTTNYNVLRNSIYVVNITIHSLDDIESDTRVVTQQEFLHIRFPFSDIIDGHYVYRPLYYGGLKGIAKVEVGYLDTPGDYSSFVPVDDEKVNYEWLTLQSLNPVSDPIGSEVRTLYIDFNDERGGTDEDNNHTGVDAVTGATVYAHAADNLNQASREMIIRTTHYPNALPEHLDAIKNGEYEITAGLVYLYQNFKQAGVSYMGKLGGWNGSEYTKGLVVETYEEYLYTPMFKDEPPEGSILGLPYWGSNAAYQSSTLNPYDGNRDVYNAGWPTNAGISNYNRRWNTFAVNYCMAKNKGLPVDMNAIPNSNITSTFVAEGWYLPTAAQLLTINAVSPLLSNPLTLNGPSDFYFSIGQKTAANAIAVNQYGFPVDRSKYVRAWIRCVRDVDPIDYPGPDFVYRSSTNGHGNYNNQMIVSLPLAGFSSSSYTYHPPGWANGGTPRMLESNLTYSRQFVVSLSDQYPKSPGDNSICPVGFRLPTQREMFFIVAIEPMLLAQNAPGFQYVPLFKMAEYVTISNPTGSTDNSVQYTVVPGTGEAFIRSNNAATTYPLRARCVRDVVNDPFDPEFPARY